MSDRGIHAVIETLHIDLENPVEIAFHRRFETAHVRDASVIDENLYSIVLEQSLENSFYIFLTRHIALEGRRITACRDDLKRDDLCLFSIDIENPNATSALREPMGNGAPDTASTSSDDSDFAVQPK